MWKNKLLAHCRARKPARWPAVVALLAITFFLGFRLYVAAYVPPLFTAIGVRHRTEDKLIYPGMPKEKVERSLGQPLKTTHPRDKLLQPYRDQYWYNDGVGILYYRDVMVVCTIDMLHWEILDEDLAPVINDGRSIVFYDSNGAVSGGYLGYGPDGVWIKPLENNHIELRYTWRSPGDPGFWQ